MLTEWDKIRNMLTREEYKAWVERGVWPKRLNDARNKYRNNLAKSRKADTNRNSESEA